MAKSKRAMNPADALRKKQRKRELKKNKEDRKRARELALSKKDLGKVKQEIARLEHLSKLGQLDRNGQTRLESLRADAIKIEKAKKATELTGAQAAFMARMQEQEKKQEGEARKLVYDPNRGAFVPVKKKASTKKTEKSDVTSSSETDSDTSDSSDESSDESDSDQEHEEEEKEEKEEEEEEEGEDVPMPTPVEAKKVLTESDDEYEIPLPPGPPPHRPFEDQLTPIQTAQQQQQRAPPPPPPGPPPFPMARIPPPPPPLMYYPYPQQRPQHPPPPPPIPYHFRPTVPACKFKQSY
ncbi:WW domain binding protein 11-domain-containing protein [Cokeromyces recurvatus]|uniref:WW domain binding protein 11-domain-containing protein n=1 Tax=Cokeromyces recurvatus TaxID=90255 RepID=UPI00222115E6|nr:WW domain binding protein 11-domain-containing protein [Cokeromyces recurvatus]KAI7900989.1 WW domain binding protein 11-domain-containing protein [Cokeromyces recurvatus]